MVIAVLVNVYKEPPARAIGRDCVQPDQRALIVAAEVLFDYFGCKCPWRSQGFVRCRVVVALARLAAAEGQVRSINVGAIDETLLGPLCESPSFSLPGIAGQIQHRPTMACWKSCSLPLDLLN